MPLWEKRQLTDQTFEGICMILSHISKGTGFLHQAVMNCITHFVTPWWRKGVPFKVLDKIIHIPSSTVDQPCFLQGYLKHLLHIKSFTRIQCYFFIFFLLHLVLILTRYFEYFFIISKNNSWSCNLLLFSKLYCSCLTKGYNNNYYINAPWKPSL